MDYSTDFILRAVQAAQGRATGCAWGDRPLGERVTLIYREMQRLHGQASPKAAFGGTESLWSRASDAWHDTNQVSPR